MPSIAYRRFDSKQILSALDQGWRRFRAIPGVSVAFAAVFAFIGLCLLSILGYLGISPMALPFAGGFMLIGPALLAGFFRLSDVQSEGGRPGLSDAFGAFIRAPAGLWGVSLVCAFLFLIWITDAAVLYAFMIGGEHLPYELPWLIGLQENVVDFELWASVMGSVLAYAIFCVSAFSVPLLYQKRTNLVSAVSASARAVLGNFIPGLAWGLLLSVTITVSIILLPLLLVSLPVLAYASFDLYVWVMPPVSAPTPDDGRD